MDRVAYEVGMLVCHPNKPDWGPGKAVWEIPYHSTAATNRAWIEKVPANGLLSSGVG
ncbi:MAG: DUF3553 domain-containing protein [Phycisphaerae bacterium]|jgi:hypothetical protein|nr:DUF3553 domain-containing protein [Phycisphaerae bacterium]